VQDPALGQKLRILGLCVAGLVLAIFLGAQIGNSKYWPLLLGTVILIVLSLPLFSGHFFWVLTIASSFLEGTFPILGGSFTPFQILMAIGVAKFLITDVVLRHARIQKPARFDTLLIASFMAIVVWHGVHDRFGMKFLGSNVWGGRNYVNVFVGLAAFFVILTIPIKPKLWAKFPYVVLAVTLFDLTISVITKIFPGTIYTIYPFYSAVSTAGLVEIVTGDIDITERVGGFGNFGFVLITLVLASVSLRQILHPSNFFRLVALIVGACSALYSGFRTAVINSLVGIFAAGIRDLRWAVLALLPMVAVFLFAVSFVNSEVVGLPKQVQRSLVFMPGNWDTEMVLDAQASNDFRMQIWSFWLRNYFPAHPFLGRGFGFKSKWAQASRYRYDPNANQQSVETGNIHNGFLAALDCFGIVGTIPFVLWNFRLLVRTFQVPPPRNDPEGIALRFLAIYLAVWIMCYWMGAATVGSFLPREFALAAVFLRLQREGNVVAEAPASSSPQQARRIGNQFATAKR
jgi:O-Antigen ligase